MGQAEVGDAIATVALLAEPVRRALYEYVARQPREVSRDEAAHALAISRVLAAFHLDKLVQAGLLEATYRRISGRKGPGAGRPSKLYRRSGQEVEISLPQRRYDLIARLFVDSLEDPRAVSARDALYEAAQRYGAMLGQETRQRAGGRAGRRRLLKMAVEELKLTGFEPYQDGDVIRLRNCPFDQVARGHQSLVCGANLSLTQGFLNGLELHEIKAILDPGPGRCCVALRSVESSVIGPAA